MESIYSERKALREYISFIKEERRKLSDEYWKSIERLRQLDEKAESVGQNELVSTLMEMISEQNKTVDNLRELLSLSSQIEQPLPIFEKGSIVDKNLIERQKEFDEKSSSIKRKSRWGDIHIYSRDVASFLKERNEPVKLSDIGEYLLTHRGYKVVNLSNTMNRIVDINPKVKRIARGLYEYSEGVQP